MKVLILGPYAPYGQVGAIRIISLSRYLVEKGHNVTILCLSENTLRKIDPKGLNAKIPEGTRVVTYDITTEVSSIMQKNAINEKECTAALAKLLDEEKFDVVLVSGGPFYSFRAMKEVRKLKIPYVVDYRDLHLSSPDKRKRNRVKDKIKFWLSFPARYYQEASCIYPAKCVTVVAPDMRDNLSNYFHLNKDKISIVYNGFDEAALEDFYPVGRRDSIFTVGYFGKLMYYNQDYSKMLFRTLEKFNFKGMKVRLLHIGPENLAIKEYLHQNNMNGCGWYECVGQMNYHEGMELLASCDACALEYAYPEGPGTKIFDYIYLNKPVIGITKPGISLEKMLQTFDHAYICHNETDIEQAIFSLMTGNVTELIDSDQAKDVIKSYSRSKQNAVFEEIFSRIIDEAKQWQ